MGLSAVNLNHLAALDALILERNVGRAARRMGVTQSAMSHTLRVLHETFDDPLLVRAGNEMVLTPRAESMQTELRAGLATLEGVVRGRSAFDPTTIEDEFTLAVHDGTATALVAPLLRRLIAAAPKATLHLSAINPETLAEDLRSGAVDLAIVPPMFDLSGLETESGDWTAIDMVVILRRDHPRVGKRLSLDRFCAIPHATVSLGSAQSGSYLDELLAKQGRRRTLAVRVAYVSALGEVLEVSDLLAVVPRAAAQALFCKRWNLRFVEAPLALPRMPAVLAWHGRFTADPAQRFFRDVVRDALREIAEQAESDGMMR